MSPHAERQDHPKTLRTSLYLQLCLNLYLLRHTHTHVPKLPHWVLFWWCHNFSLSLTKITGGATVIHNPAKIAKWLTNLRLNCVPRRKMFKPVLTRKELLWRVTQTVDNEEGKARKWFILEPLGEGGKKKKKTCFHRSKNTGTCEICVATLRDSSALLNGVLSKRYEQYMNQNFSTCACNASAKLMRMLCWM